MATDVILNEGDGSVVVVAARVLKAEASDFMLDAAERRKVGNDSPYRRALVHDQNDGLTINFADDYPGGITLNGVAGVTPRQDTGKLLTRTLVVHGDISYEKRGFQRVGGGADRIQISLTEQLGKLEGQVSELIDKVAALEARLK